MDLYPDFKDLLAAFAASGVRYVLIGGYAVMFHGRPRATKDLDLLVAVDEGNRERLGKALREFGAPAGIVEAARMMTDKDVVYFGASPLRVDLLGSASGLDFDGVHERAIVASLDDVAVPVIGLDDLIVNKRAAGRPRDLDDCTVLERVRDKRGG
jgi:predicted nucleotidyltransferase